MRIVVVAKEKPGLEQAVKFLREKSRTVDVFIGQRGEPFPHHAFAGGVDYTVSYLAPWIVPASALALTRIAAVNFHPGPPQYPGSGCTNFALYDGVTEYGVTAHIMNASVDTGKILMVSRFPVKEADSVYSVTQSCYQEISRIFPLVMNSLMGGSSLPPCDEKWTRKPFTRKELDALCEITPQMTAEEVQRRVRATTYPGMPGPFTTIHGYRFDLKVS